MISGGKSHVVAPKTKMLALLTVMGEASRIDKQPLWASQAHRGWVLSAGLPAHSWAWAGLGWEAADASPGQVPILSLPLQAAGGCSLPQIPGWGGRQGTKCLLLSTAKTVSVRLWCLPPAGLWSAHCRLLIVSFPVSFKGSGRVLNWGCRTS